MKLKKIMATVVVLCASCFYALAQDVTIEAKNVRLEQILDQISDQTGCSFYYSRPTVNPDDIYSLSVKELDLSSTLSILFREKDVAFDIKDDKVYLTARKDKAQESSGSANTVSGVIMDSYGVPLVGAAVLVKGTTTGTMTDENGKYVLEGVSPGDVLEFVSIGFKTETRPVGGNSVINLTMQIDSNLLEETVIVGYGSQKKINLTGAVATVTGSEIIDRPSTNLSSMLQGLTPGLMVTQGAGTPGDDGATIRIRGVGTMNSASPYILVDGIETGTINMLDPNEIESISITPEKSYKVKESSASTDDELQTVKTEIGIIKDDLYKKSRRNRIIRAAIYTMIGVVFLLLLAFALILVIPLLTNWDNKSFVSLISFNLSSATDILLLFGFVLGVIICGVFAGYVCTKKISKRGRKSNDEK